MVKSCFEILISQSVCMAILISCVQQLVVEPHTSIPPPPKKKIKEFIYIMYIISILKKKKKKVSKIKVPPPKF